MAHLSESTHGGLSRRTFLTAGGAVLASALVFKASPMAPPSSLSALAAKRGPRLSVGYIDGTDGATAAELRAVLAEGGARVTPAASMRSGAARLRDGSALVHIDGEPLGTIAGRGRAQLDALLAPRGMTPDEPVPFYAWTLDESSNVGTQNDVSFAVPYDREPSFGLAVRTKPAGAAADAPWSESNLVFTGGADRGMAKLRPGSYVVGLDDNTWKTSRTLPAAGDSRWSSLTSLLLSVTPT